MSVHVEDRPWFVEAESVPPVIEDEGEWIAKARAREESAYRWLLDRYRERAIRLAAHVLRAPDEAEDVAQEAFVRAFRNIRSFRGESRFYTWIYHIVVRICLDRRKLARWTREVGMASAPLPSGEGSRASDTRILVEALMDRLTPPMRAALVLREIEGLEYEEIALVLEIPVGTVRSRLNTARSRFRDMWEAGDQEARNV